MALGGIRLLRWECDLGCHQNLIPGNLGVEEWDNIGLEENMGIF